MKFLEWMDRMRCISDGLGGDLDVVKMPSVGSPCDYYVLKGCISYKTHEINIEHGFTKGDYENGLPGRLEAYLEFKNKHPIWTYAKERTFFDSLSKRHQAQINDLEFDKKYVVKSNDRSLASKLYNSSNISSVFLRDDNIIFVINSEGRLSRISAKNTLQKLYSLDEFNIIITLLKQAADIYLPKYSTSA